MKYLENFDKNILKDEVIIVTGAGRGIGFESARGLLSLGAKVILAEIDEKNGKKAYNELEEVFGSKNLLFIKTDVGNEKDIIKLEKEAIKVFEKVDVIVNNATIVSGIMGAVKDKPIQAWDQSYRVNLRGPVLLARKFLPGMIARKHGVFICVSSSGAAPYMGPYEVFKTAQVELANTLAIELENSGVFVFTIGPGIVPTPGFLDGGGQVAKYLNITTEELLEMNKAHELTAEAAGAGFTAAVVLASKYHGQETSSIQILRSIGVLLTEESQQKKDLSTSISLRASKLIENQDISHLYRKVLQTFIEQSEGWKSRNLFERQWISRDFKKTTQLSINDILTTLKNFEKNITNPEATHNFIEILRKLFKYYEHQQLLLKDFEKDPNKLKENLEIMNNWILDCKNLIRYLMVSEVC